MYILCHTVTTEEDAKWKSALYSSNCKLLLADEESVQMWYISTESKREESQNQPSWKVAIFIQLWLEHSRWMYKAYPKHVPLSLLQPPQKKTKKEVTSYDSSISLKLNSPVLRFVLPPASFLTVWRQKLKSEWLLFSKWLICAIILWKSYQRCSGCLVPEGV